MGAKTKIEWTDASWNPVTGCEHGCEYCYARRIANRFKMKGVKVGERAVGFELKEPVRNPDGKIEPYPFGFTATLHKYRLNEPSKWKKPRNIFVCSMADLFGDWVLDEWITQVFDACVPPHRYLFLTKNPKRYWELYDKGLMPTGENAKNMWFGCSVTTEDTQFFYIEGDSERATNHNGFLSIEPILGDFPVRDFSGMGIKWAIIGAETGNRKGKVVPQKEWIDHLCESFDISGIRVFMKDSLVPIVGENNMRREFPWED